MSYFNYQFAIDRVLDLLHLTHRECRIVLSVDHWIYVTRPLELRESFSILQKPILSVLSQWFLTEILTMGYHNQTCIINSNNYGGQYDTILNTQPNCSLITLVNIAYVFF